MDNPLGTDETLRVMNLATTPRKDEDLDSLLDDLRGTQESYDQEPQPHDQHPEDYQQEYQGDSSGVPLPESTIPPPLVFPPPDPLNLEGADIDMLYDTIDSLTQQLSTVVDKAVKIIFVVRLTCRTKRFK